ncbi:MAG: hypothetical protein ABW126_07990, partial [Candidatus Sedimenticola sp. 4PFRAG1]
MTNNDQQNRNRFPNCKKLLNIAKKILAALRKGKNMEAATRLPPVQTIEQFANESGVSEDTV